MGKVRVGLTVVAAVLVLAGCVGRTGGDPERAPATGEPVQLNVNALDGEVSPCSLTGPAAFQPHGIARMPGRPDMDSCRVWVATDHGPVYVWVGEQSVVGLLSKHRTVIADMGRGATVERFGDGCDAALVYGGVSVISVVASSAGDDVVPEELLCELTSSAAKGVFEVLAGDRVKFWTPAPNSLATLALCEVLPSGLVTEQVDLPSVLEPTFAPSAHWCRWGEFDGNWMMLRTPVAESPIELGVPGNIPTELIAGRESWVVPGQVNCTVYYQHIEFEPGVGTFEFAELTVTIPDDPCTAARTLAASAWEHLPNAAS